MAARRRAAAAARTIARLAIFCAVAGPQFQFYYEEDGEGEDDGEDEEYYILGGMRQRGEKNKINDHEGKISSKQKNAVAKKLKKNQQNNRPSADHRLASSQLEQLGLPVHVVERSTLAMMTATELARAMPKAELHIHIEGSLEPELIFQLAQRNGVPLAFPSVEALRAAYAFTDLQSFLDIYYAGASVLLKRQDFFDLAWAYFQRAKADNVIHAELFFDPQTHTGRGVPMAAVIEGLSGACQKAQAELGISSSLILCFLRHLSEKDAFATLEAALPFREHFIGVGLDSSELGHPPEKFERVFARCRELGLHLVAHAGEEGPPAYMWQAIDKLKVQRIDHGVAVMQDPLLVGELARTRVPLTVCPLSNLKLCVVKDLRDLPLKQMLAAGLCVTVNSDDPAYFGGYMNTNFEQTVQALELSRDDVIQLARNSFEASFIDDARRAACMAQLRVAVTT